MPTTTTTKTTNKNKTTAEIKINTFDAEAFFASLTQGEIEFQTSYWSALQPINDTERFQRALFAYTSVHTSWKSNIAAYSLIKEWWVWMNQWHILDEKLRKSGAGLYNNRVRFIKDFSEKYWSNPSFYHKAEQESWTVYRNRIEKKIIGLGMAKSSFFIEMLYPTTAEITCLDTHLFQLYGLDQSKNAKLYQDIEAHWVRMCFEYNVPCYVARCIYWDRKQGHTNSRYWSHVLEEGDFAEEVQY
jgi:thermostable 8-oxoguanine DNA glycosylase